MGIIIANIAGVQAYASEDVNITASQGKGEPGDTVDITFSMKNNPGTTMYEMYISYDSDNLEVESVEDCGNYPEWLEPNPSNYPLYISAGDALSLKDLTDSYDLAVIHFKIKENAAAGDYYFTVQKGLFLSGQLQQFEVTYDNSGVITVGSDGNNTGDGNVTSGNSAESNGVITGDEGTSAENTDNQSVNENNSEENQDGTDSEQKDSTELSSLTDNTDEETSNEIKTNKNDENNQVSNSTDSKKNNNLSVKIVVVLAVVLIVIFLIRILKKKKEE